MACRISLIMGLLICGLHITCTYDDFSKKLAQSDSLQVIKHDMAVNGYRRVVTGLLKNISDSTTIKMVYVVVKFYDREGIRIVRLNEVKHSIAPGDVWRWKVEWINDDIHTYTIDRVFASNKSFYADECFRLKGRTHEDKGQVEITNVVRTKEGVKWVVKNLTSSVLNCGFAVKFWDRDGVPIYEGRQSISWLDPQERAHLKTRELPADVNKADKFEVKFTGAAEYEDLLVSYKSHKKTKRNRK